jgi:hypothetical protein
MPYATHARRRIHPAPAPAAAVALLTLLLGACASDSPMQGALRESIGNPFGGPTEQGFQDLVRKHCGDRLVGGQSVATLLDGDSTFRQLSGRLYRGDPPNDAFMQQLLQEYPAADANIPATGCVIRQLNTCLNTKCDGRAAPSPDDIAARDIDATRDANLDELPAADPAAVDALIEGGGGAGIDDIGPMPSEDPQVLSPGTQPERVEPISTPSQP